MKLLKFVFGVMLSFSLARSANASLPQWPSWLEKSNLVRLSQSMQIAGVTVNALEFVPTTNSGQHSAQVNFGFIDSENRWNETKIFGKYRDVFGVLIEVGQDASIADLTIGEDRQVRDRKNKNVVVGSITTLQINEKYTLAPDKNSKTKATEFVRFGQPFEFTPGVFATAMRFNPVQNRAYNPGVTFGNLSEGGVFEPIPLKQWVDWKWMYSRTHSDRVLLAYNQHNPGGFYLDIDEKTGEVFSKKWNNNLKTYERTSLNTVHPIKITNIDESYVPDVSDTRNGVAAGSCGSVLLF